MAERSQKPIRVLDLFCGAGGSSWGAMSAGCEIAGGIDVSETAGRAFQQNFPEAEFHCSSIETLDPAKVRRRMGPIDLLLASPECTNHSPAKGSAPRCEASKRTALEVVRFAEAMKPQWIVIENVVNMRRWTRYEELLSSLRAINYHVDPHILNAMHFGVPQSRRRLFIVCRRESKPADILMAGGRTRNARSIVRIDETFDWSPLRREKRAKDTLTRADRAIHAVGINTPFLIVYYGSDGAGGWQRLDRPLRTITTLDRFAIVRPTAQGHMMRMLQVPELKAAMGMPRRFVPGLGTRRDQIRAIGNAVCPPVMRAVVAAITRARTPAH